MTEWAYIASIVFRIAKNCGE